MSERILKVNSLIHREIGKIIFKDLDFPEKTLVTVTRVETSSNLIQTKVYISAMPDDKIGEVLAILNSQIYFLQQELNKKINMRPMPKLIFLEETKTREAGRIEELLEEIKNKNGK